MAAACQGKFAALPCYSLSDHRSVTVAHGQDRTIAQVTLWLPSQRASLRRIKHGPVTTRPPPTWYIPSVGERQEKSQGFSWDRAGAELRACPALHLLGLAGSLLRVTEQQADRCLQPPGAVGFLLPDQSLLPGRAAGHISASRAPGAQTPSVRGAIRRDSGCHGTEGSCSPRARGAAEVTACTALERQSEGRRKERGSGQVPPLPSSSHPHAQLGDAAWPSKGLCRAAQPPTRPWDAPWRCLAL